MYSEEDSTAWNDFDDDDAQVIREFERREQEAKLREAGIPTEPKPAAPAVTYQAPPPPSGDTEGWSPDAREDKNTTNWLLAERLILVAGTGAVISAISGITYFILSMYS